MRTYDELNKLTEFELEKIKQAELERISANEIKRQELIRNILCLQQIKSNADFRRDF